MNTQIFYFSGTGNSLAVAKQLSGHLPDSQLIPIAQVWQQNQVVVENGQVGLVFPLYFWGLPYIVRDFVRKLDVRQARYRFAVVTRGWPIPGGALRQLNQSFKGQNAALQAGWYVNLPDNDILLADGLPEAKRQVMYQRAQQKVQQIARQVQQQAHGIAWEPLAPFRPVAQQLFFNHVDTSDRRFTVSAECNSCGICQKVCPVKNIALSAGAQPHWQHRCQQCLACLHLCPQQAIEYGTATRGRTRFHHPAVTLKELMAQHT